MGKIFKLVVVGAAILAPRIVQAQWPDDPEVNLLISNKSGEETVPHIAAGPDGGCYVSWWDNTSGQYWLYLQRLGPDGQIMWQQDGLLVSNHPQDTWLTDYGLTVDSQNHAILTILDLRIPGDWDVYAYRISPAGEFVWGPDGKTITSNTNMELTPFVTIANDGDFLFGWTEDINNRTVIGIRKVSPDGNDAWDPPIFTMHPTYGLTIPRIVAAEAGGFIVQALVSQGPNFYDPKILTAYKFDSSHNPVWGDTGVVVSNAGGFDWFMKPLLASDDHGGAYSYWYDGRDMEPHVYVQHTDSSGNRLWQENGLKVNSIPGELQFEPVLVSHPATGDVMVFFPNSDWNQTLVGVNGQKINSAGEKLWGDGGLAFAPLDNPLRMFVQAEPYGDGAIVAYLENADPNFLYCHARALRVNGAGQRVWDPDTSLFVSSVYSAKGYFGACINPLGQFIMAWMDKRADPNGDLYLQNINPDGTLGGYQTGVVDGPALPAGYHLAQNYPNPFNAATVIEYFLPRSQNVTVEVFDLTGRRVEVLDEGMRPAGHHRITWDASWAPSGIYFYRVGADEFSESRRMTLLK